MYDALTARYTFACPTARADPRLALGVPRARAAARRRAPGGLPCPLRLPGGDEHPGLVAHDELDWAPLGGCEACSST